MSLTVHLPADDFNIALANIDAAFQRGEIDISSHKKGKYLVIHVHKNTERVHDRILAVCPDADIKEQEDEVL